MKIITTLLESVGEERSRDLKEKIMGSLVEDSALSEFSGSLLGKRRRFDSQFKTITDEKERIVEKVRIFLCSATI